MSPADFEKVREIHREVVTLDILVTKHNDTPEATGFTRILERRLDRVVIDLLELLEKEPA